jgi:WD40 repeat protein/serine/threonine protein kinase/tetratricopeptide (TPR) repeat protein
MTHLLTCPNGHRWEVADTNPSPADGRPLSCPFCGAAHVTLGLAELPPDQETNVAGTLAPPEPSRPAATPELPTIPGYEVLGVLGRGGMGVVYKARQQSLKRLVALKMILSGAHAGSQELERFRVEAEAAARLQHPNIVQIYEVGEQGGLPFCSLEYVDGGSLASRLGGTPLPAHEAAALTEVLARAVHHAHQRGIVHRDLKPANVLLRKKSETISKSKIQNPKPAHQDVLDLGHSDLGIISDFGFRISDFEAKITDFGLAKRLDEDSGQTRSGAVLGTPSYMAPEQAEGRTREIGPPADVYALGAILYETLTGRPPFRGATALDTLEQVRSQEPVPPRLWQPKVPRDLETICLKCLHKEPRKRYASALALADDLRRFLAGEPILAKAVGPLERGVKWVRRRPAIAALSATIVLVTLLGFAGVLGQWQRAEEKRLQAEAAEQQATEKAEVATKAQGEADEARKQATARAEAERQAKDDALRAEKAEREQREKLEVNLYFHSVALAEREWLAGNVVQAFELLDDCPLRLRRWEWHYLKRVARADVFSHGTWTPASGVAFSPDGKYLHVLIKDLGVQVWDVAADRAVYPFFLGHHPAHVLGMACGPDPLRLATAGADKRATLWSLEPNRALHADLLGHTAEVTAVAFSPDGKRLASASLDKTVKLWDTTTGQELLTLRGHDGGVTSVAFSPLGENSSGKLGKRLASAGADGKIKIHDTATGKEVLTLRRHNRPVRSVAFSPDGQRLASSSEDGTAVISDAATGQVLLTIREQSNVSSNVAFSPDGRRFAAGLAGDQSGTVKVWDTVTGRTLLTFHGHLGTVNSVAFSSDGQRLASVGGAKVKVWDVTTGPEARAIRAHPGDITCVAYSPDGRRFVSAGGPRTKPGQSAGEVKLWDAATNQEILTLAGHQGGVKSLAFSPDGKRLASAGAGGDKPGQSGAEVKVWNVADGRHLHTLKGPGGFAVCVAFSPDGRRLTAAAMDGSVRTWDADTGLELRTFRLTLPQGWQLFTAVLSPDGTRLAAASALRGKEAELKVWDVSPDEKDASKTGKEVLSLRSHAGGVGSMAFSPNGRLLAVGSTGWDEEGARRDGEVKVWDAGTGQELLTLKGHSYAVLGLAFSPDGGSRLASASLDKTVKVWDTGSGQLTFTLRGHTDAVTCAAFSPDGERLATGSSDHTVRVWDGARSREILALRHAFQYSLGRVSFTRDGGTRLVATGWGFAQVWDATTGQRLLAVGDEHGGPIYATFSSDGRRLARVGSDKTLKIWDGTTGREIVSRPGPAAAVGALLFSPDGRRLAGATTKKDVAVWNADTGEEVFSFPGAGSSVVFTPDGQRLVSSGEDAAAMVWDLATGRETFLLPGAGAVVIVSPDGRWLASADKTKTLTIWDAATGRQVHRVPDGGFPRAFSPDSRRFITIPRDQILAIWNTATGRPTATVRSATGFNGVVFSPDGSRLAWGSGGADGNVTVCDATTGRTLLSLRGHTNWVSSVEFSPDGRRLASASPLDRTVRVWDVGEREEREQPAGMPTPTWHAQEAEDSEAAGQWFAAIYHLDRLLAAQPESADLRLRRGRAHMHLGQSDQALDDFAAALRRAPEDGTVWLAQSFAYSKLEQWGKAAADYAKAVEYSRSINRAAPWWLVESAPDDRHLRSWSAALADCTRILDAGTAGGWTWRGRGLAHAALGEWEQAAADFSKAIEARPDDWEAWQGRSHALRVLSKQDQAAADCTRALELKKDDGNLWRLQGTIHSVRSQWDKAIDAYSRAIELGADGWGIRAERGSAHAALRRWETAEADYLEAIELKGDHWQVWERLGSVQAELGSWDKADAAFVKAAAKADQPGPWHALALLQLRRGDREGYRKTCADLLERFGQANNFFVLHQVARACVLGPEAGVDRARIVPLAEGGVKVSPQYAPYLATLGAAHYRAGQFDDGVRRLNEAVKAYGNVGTSDTWLYLAMTHHRLRQPEEAKRWLDKAVEWVEQNVREKPPGAAPPALPWQQRLELQLLLQEARELVKPRER